MIVDVWRIASQRAARRWPGRDHEDAVGWAFTAWLATGARCEFGPWASAACVVRRAGQLLDPRSRRRAATWVQPITLRLEARWDGRDLIAGQSPSGEPWREDLAALAAVPRGVLARSLGVSTEALRAWGKGTRSPGPASRAALADAAVCARKQP